MKILRSYTWNNHRYCVVLLADGSSIEIKGDPKMTDDEAIKKAEAIPAPTPIEAPATLAESTTEQIKAEVQRRGLTAKDLGLTVEAKP